MSDHRDEKALNQALSTALAARLGSLSAPKAERTKVISGSSRQPDVVVDAPGHRLRVLVENKYASRPEKDLVSQCEAWKGASWASDRQPVRVVVGVRSPDDLDDASDTELASALEAARFEWAAWSFLANGDVLRLPHDGWLAGSLAELAGFIDRAGADAHDVADLANTVRGTLMAAAGVISDPTVMQEFGEVLTQEPGDQTNRMAMAIMFNAVLFQGHIARHHSTISSPTQMLNTDKVNQRSVSQMWQRVLDINYWPIFGISRKLLDAIPDEASAKQAMRILFESAASIAADARAPGLVGRLFGELIGDRKFLATFYTKPPSAALLAELAVARVDADFGDADKLAELRVADLACGTGALLTAAYRRIAERHRLGGGNDGAAHSGLLENAMIGCDIMAAAVHLTAARLSGEHPEIDYRRTKTWLLRYGLPPDGDAEADSDSDDDGVRIGALDLLNKNGVQALWGDGTIEVTPQGDQETQTASVPHESLHIAIMNPPFTRSTGHEASKEGVPNPAFAGLGQDEQSQKTMGKALDQEIKSLKSAARRKSRTASLPPVPVASHGNAGLGSAFADLAHAKLRKGGTMALILPVTVVSGDSWGKTRELLTSQFRDITIITIADYGTEVSTGRAFSADTGIAEAIVVATKLEQQPHEHRTEAIANFVTLDRAPASIMEAVEIARCVTQSRASTHPTVLRIGDARIGWVLAAPFGPDVSGQPSGVQEPDVAATAVGLTRGKLILPRHDELPLPITRLGALGQRGPYHADINGVTQDGSPRGPFDVDLLPDRRHYTKKSWPVLWSHNHTLETTMKVLPCSFGTTRSGQRINAQFLWDGTPQICGATRLHINRDWRLNSQPTTACLTPSECLGGRAWPSFALESHTHERAMCAWLNSTLGMIVRWYHSGRQQGGRANLGVTSLGSIPVVDLNCLSDDDLDRLANVYDDFEDEPLLPANEAFGDNARIALDRAVLCDALHLPTTVIGPLDTVRLQWCSEPSVHGAKKSKPA